MKAAIITIGDEILIGQITDTNSGFIAKSLDAIGVEVAEMRSISDNKAHILQTFQALQNNFDLVIITGGLGPTISPNGIETVAVAPLARLSGLPWPSFTIISIMPKVVKIFSVPFSIPY
jgi:molybdenum cofactor synthesis domain-containing protein